MTDHLTLCSEKRLRELLEREQELWITKSELITVREAVAEIAGMVKSAKVYYAGKGQKVNVTPTLTLSAAKKIERLLATFDNKKRDK